MTLLETIIAIAVLAVATSGIMGIAAVGTLTTENQGNLGSRTAEYAQDKMEQLIALTFNDGPPNATDTTQFPSCGPTACNNGTGLAVGGSYDPTAPVTGYVDYLDNLGNPLGGMVAGAAPAGWYYIRVWSISTFSSNLKQITVTAKVNYGVGTREIGALAQSTVSTLKSNPF